MELSIYYHIVATKLSLQVCTQFLVEERITTLHPHANLLTLQAEVYAFNFSTNKIRAIKTCVNNKSIEKVNRVEIID